MTTTAARLLTALHAALRAQGCPEPLVLECLPDKGLAHHHVRLVGHGLLARVPKQSQMGLPPEANLRYQAACFARAAKSGHAPRLLGRLPPQPTSAAPGAPEHPLARGALLVEEIIGTPPALPAALPALVDALAAIHGLPLPEPASRPPLLDEPDALVTLAQEIDAQAMHLQAAAPAPEVLARIEAVRARWRRLVAAPARPPRRLITFDAHPGNFLVTPQGRAVIVDLEKARYSHPPLDLAHATLYTSTTWDVATHAVLALDDVVSAGERWMQALGEADRWRPWIVPLREAMWLWAVTWCAKWRAVSGRAPAAAGGEAAGEDWSAARSDASLIAHVRGRVDEYLSPAGVDFVLRECEALRRYWGAAG